MDQLKDTWYTIKDTFLEMWDGVQDRFPFLSEIPQHKIELASGAAILLSLICVVKTLGNSQSAAALEEAAANYRAGQSQLNAVLGDSVEIAMDDESKDIIGITNLMLQYKDLTSMPSMSGITSMQNALGIGDSQTQKENDSYDASMSDKIRDFAGAFGGALVIPTTYGTNSLKLAAYTDTASMRTPKSDESNVLYERITRVITSDEYGVADTSNKVTFLSASNIKGISSVSVGSALYTLFGDEDSTGSKEAQKFICTGVATGTYVSDGTDEEEGLTEKTGTSTRDQSEETVQGYSDESEDITTDDEEAAGTDTEEEVTEESTEASVPVVKTDVSQVVITSEDVVDGDASYNSDGTVNEDWAEDNEDAETVTSDTSDDDDSASKTDDDDSGLPTSSKYSVNAAMVLDENGDPLTDNKTADLILYQYSKRSGNVKITYWNRSGSDAANKALASQTQSKATTEATTETVEEN